MFAILMFPILTDYIKIVKIKIYQIHSVTNATLNLSFLCNIYNILYSIQTLLREIKEETNKDVYEDKITPFFYQLTFRKKNNKWIEDDTQVRYITIVKNNNKFISDPDMDIIENKWIKINELDKYLIGVILRR